MVRRSQCKVTPEAVAYFSQLHAELIKVDTFFLRELAFFEAQFAQWRDQLGLLVCW